MLRNKIIILGGVAILSAFAASSVQAAGDTMFRVEPVYFSPGPLHAPVTPRYYDPYHQDHDFNYWQEKHDEALRSRMDHEAEMMQRRQQAERMPQPQQFNQ